jgi:methyltransferase
MSLLWIFAYLILERLLELHVSRKHRLALEERGGREFYPETFALMAGLHSLFLLALFWESHPWRILGTPLNGALLGFFVLLQGLRYWCIHSLGEAWNTRIVLVPGGRVQKRGPYLLLAHPNYLVVTLEFLTLPLLMHAPFTLAIFFPANLLILRQRIRLEERALRQFTDYGERFPVASPTGDRADEAVL